MKSLGFAAIVISLYAVAACSASSTRAGSGGPSGTGGEGASGSAGGEGGEGGRLACELQDTTACLQCCVDDHPDGSETIDSLFYSECGCDRGAVCADVCDTDDDATDLCLDDDTFNFAIDNEDCKACLLEIADDATDPCVAAVQEGCGMNDECLAFGKCQRSCPVE